MRSIISGPGAQGLLGALTDVAGGQQQYLGTLQALGRLDAFGASAQQDRARAALTQSVLDARNALPRAMSGLRVPEGMTADALSAMALANEQIDWDNLGKYQTGLQARNLRDDALAAYRGGQPQAGYETLAVLEGKAPERYRFGDFGTGDQATGLLQESAALRALAAQRSAAARASDAAARGAGYITLGDRQTLVDVTGDRPRGLDTRPIPAPEVLAVQTGVPQPLVQQQLRHLGSGEPMPWGGTEEQHSRLRAALDGFYARGGADNMTALERNTGLYQRIFGMTAQDALRASARCAARAPGSVACAASSASISARPRKVNLRRYSETLASSVFTKNW